MNKIIADGGDIFKVGFKLDSDDGEEAEYTYKNHYGNSMTITVENGQVTSVTGNLSRSFVEDILRVMEPHKGKKKEETEAEKVARRTESPSGRFRSFVGRPVPG